MSPIKTMNHSHDNKYILVIINYVTKWVEAKVLKTKVVLIVIQFIYEFILTRFSSPLIWSTTKLPILSKIPSRSLPFIFYFNTQALQLTTPREMVS